MCFKVTLYSTYRSLNYVRVSRSGSLVELCVARSSLGPLAATAVSGESTAQSQAPSQAARRPGGQAPFTCSAPAAYPRCRTVRAGAATMRADCIGAKNQDAAL